MAHMQNTQQSTQNPMAISIFVDADACPVKDEIYRVAERYQIKTYIVANQYIKTPREDYITPIIVGQGLNIADDWIAKHVDCASIVITNDIPLADRVVKALAVALSPTGRLFDQASIGNALATRNLMENLRESGQITSGPKPFLAKNRSNFLSALDLAIQRLKRRGFVTHIF